MRLWNHVVKGSPWRVLSIVFALLVIIVELIAIRNKLNEAPAPNPTAHAAVEAPSQEEVALATRVHEAHVALKNSDEGNFAAQCLAQFGPAFTHAAKLTGINEEVLVGIAAYESAGCTEPKGDDANVMHVTFPDPRHVLAAEHMLGKPTGTLRWESDITDNVVLGGVMLAEYATRTGSLPLGLSAYRHGPNKAVFGDDYTVVVLAHISVAEKLISAPESLAKR